MLPFTVSAAFAAVNSAAVVTLVVVMFPFTVTVAPADTTNVLNEPSDVMFPLIVTDTADEIVTIPCVVVEPVIFAVIVRAVETRKLPPAAAGDDALLRSSATVMSWSIVTVYVLGRTTSPAPGSVPPSQTVVSDQLPVFTAYRFAIV
jgi:hypothetical protein